MTDLACKKNTDGGPRDARRANAVPLSPMVATPGASGPRGSFLAPDPGEADWALQTVVERPTKREAEEALDSLRGSEGFLAGRVLRPLRDGGSWRVQVFLEDEPEIRGWLPEGVIRTVIPKGLRGLLGLPTGSSVAEARLRSVIEEAARIGADLQEAVARACEELS